jgi:uncharacterized protein (TIGR02996 family)
MSDEKALLAAIWEHPHEDTPRLMYADWLDERGGASEAARAELIRVQLELTNLTGSDPRYDALDARESELRKAWERDWWKAMPKGCKKGYFGRGFPVPYLGSFSVPGLVKLGEARLRAAPLWRYHYGVHGTDLDWFIPWPYLHRLEMFALRPPLPGDWAARMAACANLRNVTELALIDCQVGADELKLLLDTWADRPLRTLHLKLDAAGLRVLAEHPTSAKLRQLLISSSGLSADGLAILTASRHLTRLMSLSLGYNAFGAAGVAELVRWPGLNNLRYLFLNNTALTDAGAEALAACPGAANLRRLWLSMNPIGAAGATAVATSPHLARLEKVSFYDTTALRSPGVEPMLRKRFGRSRY